jgi:hypothetical protein
MQKLLSPVLVVVALVFAPTIAHSHGAGGPKCSAICTCDVLCSTPCSAPGNIMTCGGFDKCRSVPACHKAAPSPFELLIHSVRARAVCTAGDELDAEGCDL